VRESTEDLAGFLKDFERERTMVKGLRHRNLCRFYGVAVADEHYALVYQFLEGGSLTSLLQNRSKKYDLFGIALDIAEGMDYLHRKGAMHRDLKVRHCDHSQRNAVGGSWVASWWCAQSGNVLLDKEGRAVIADFGLVCPTISSEEHTGECIRQRRT
jgi:serine/threonine protein kinase